MAKNLFCKSGSIIDSEKVIKKVRELYPEASEEFVDNLSRAMILNKINGEKRDPMSSIKSSYAEVRRQKRAERLAAKIETTKSRDEKYKEYYDKIEKLIPEFKSDVTEEQKKIKIDKLVQAQLKYEEGFNKELEILKKQKKYLTDLEKAVKEVVNTKNIEDLEINSIQYERLKRLNDTFFGKSDAELRAEGYEIRLKEDKDTLTFYDPMANGETGGILEYVKDPEYGFTYTVDSEGNRIEKSPYAIEKPFKKVVLKEQVINEVKKTYDSNGNLLDVKGNEKDNLDFDRQNTIKEIDVETGNEVVTTQFLKKQEDKSWASYMNLIDIYAPGRYDFIIDKRPVKEMSDIVGLGMEAEVANFKLADSKFLEKDSVIDMLESNAKARKLEDYIKQKQKELEEYEVKSVRRQTFTEIDTEKPIFGAFARYKTFASETLNKFIKRKAFINQKLVKNKVDMVENERIVKLKGDKVNFDIEMPANVDAIDFAKRLRENEKTPFGKQHIELNEIVLDPSKFYELVSNEGLNSEGLKEFSKNAVISSKVIDGYIKTLKGAERAKYGEDLTTSKKLLEENIGRISRFVDFVNPEVNTLKTDVVSEDITSVGDKTVISQEIKTIAQKPRTLTDIVDIYNKNLKGKKIDFKKFIYSKAGEIELSQRKLDIGTLNSEANKNIDKLKPKEIAALVKSKLLEVKPDFSFIEKGREIAKDSNYENYIRNEIGGRRVDLKSRRRYGATVPELVKELRRIDTYSKAKKTSEINDMLIRNPRLIKFFKDFYPGKFKILSDILKINKLSKRRLMAEDYRILDKYNVIDFNKNTEWKDLIPHIEETLRDSKKRFEAQKDIREIMSDPKKLSKEFASVLFKEYAENKDGDFYEYNSLNSSSQFVKDNLNGGYYTFKNLSKIIPELIRQNRSTVTRAINGLKHREHNILLELTNQKETYKKLMIERKNEVEKLINEDAKAVNLNWADTILKLVLERDVKTNVMMTEEGNIIKRLDSANIDVEAIRVAVEKRAYADLADFKQTETIKSDLTKEDISELISAGNWETPADFIKELRTNGEVNNRIDAIRRAQRESSKLFTMAADVEIEIGAAKGEKLTKRQQKLMGSIMVKDINRDFEINSAKIDSSLNYIYENVNKVREELMQRDEYKSGLFGVDEATKIFNRFIAEDRNQDFFIRSPEINSAIEIKKSTIANYRDGRRMEIIFDRENGKFTVDGIKLYVDKKTNSPKIRRVKIAETSFKDKGRVSINNEKLKSFVIENRLSELESSLGNKETYNRLSSALYLEKRGLNNKFEEGDLYTFAKQIKQTSDLSFIIDKMQRQWEASDNKMVELSNYESKLNKEFIDKVKSSVPSLIKKSHYWDTALLNEKDKAKFMARSNLINSALSKRNLFDYSELLEVTNKTKARGVYKTGSPKAFDISFAKDRTKITLFGDKSSIVNFEVIKNKFDESFEVFISNGTGLNDKISSIVPKGDNYYGFVETLHNYQEKLTKGNIDIRSSAEMEAAVRDYAVESIKKNSLNSMTENFLKENKLTEKSTAEEKELYSETFKDSIVDKIKNNIAKSWDANKKDFRFDIKADSSTAIAKIYKEINRLRSEISSDIKNKGIADKKHTDYFEKLNDLNVKNNRLYEKISDGTKAEKREIRSLTQKIAAANAKTSKLIKKVSKDLESKKNKLNFKDFQELLNKERSKLVDPIRKEISDLSNKKIKLEKQILNKFKKEFNEINSNKQKIEDMQFEVRRIEAQLSPQIESKLMKLSKLENLYDRTSDSFVRLSRGAESAKESYVESRTRDVTSLLEKNYKLFGTDVKRFADALQKVSVALTGRPNNLERLFDNSSNYELADSLLKMLSQKPAGEVKDEKTGKKFEINRPLDKEWVDSQRNDITEKSDLVYKQLEENEASITSKTSLLNEYETKLSELTEESPEYNKIKELIEDTKEDINSLKEELDDLNDEINKNDFLYGIVSSLGTPERVKAFIDVFNNYIANGKYRSGSRAVVPIVDKTGNKLGETSHMYGEPLKNVVDPFKIIKDIETQEGKEVDALETVSRKDINDLIKELELLDVEVKKYEVKDEQEVKEEVTKEDTENFEEETTTTGEERMTEETDVRETEMPELNEETSNLTEEQLSKLREYHRVNGPSGVKILYEQRAGGEISSLRDLNEKDMAMIGVTVNKMNAIYKYEGKINDLIDVDGKNFPNFREVDNIDKSKNGTYSLSKNEDIVVPLVNVYEKVNAENLKKQSAQERVDEILNKNSSSRPFDEEIDHDLIENNPKNDVC